MRGKWNSWLRKNAGYLRDLQKKHDRASRLLPHNSVEDVLVAAREAALALASNQTVTVPNLASIIMLVRDRNDSILLTGDADDKSIVDGLRQAGELSNGQQCRVRVFKVPHHGAHNSYSDELARSVIADDYVFCGNGKHDNPEKEVLEDYLQVLFKGKGGKPAALPGNMKTTFWFNSGPDLHAAGSHLNKHWRKLEKVLKKCQGDYPSRFRYKFLKSGNSFVVT